jgi:ATP-dependent Clp protease ATP-binding subunit ClpA
MTRNVYTNARVQDMWERFTEQARQVFYQAQLKAAKEDKSEVEPRHLLFGLLEVDPDVLGPMLPDGSERLSALRSQLNSYIPPVRPTAVSQLSTPPPLSNASKRVLAYGGVEAERMRAEHIDRIHILLGLLREDNSSEVSMLRDYGVTAEVVCRHAQTVGNVWRFIGPLK